MERLDNCKNANCGKKLTHTEGRRPKEFCSPKCRVEFHNGKKLKGTGRGRKKGSKNKVNVVNIDGFEMDTKTVPAYDVKPQSEWGAEMNAVCLPEIKKQPLFNFRDDKFLDVEKYTKFPKKDRPTSIGERAEFDLIKKTFDNGIREAWQIHLQNKKNGQ